MYPNEIIFGMGFYEIFILIGIMLCFASFRILSDRRKYSAKYQNMVLACAFAAIVLGYIIAVIVQAVYNSLETGVFEINKQTGATFLGGLVGGTVVFITSYFIAGGILLKKTKEHIVNFDRFSSIAATMITIAHSFGRIGCFFAGCCYGKISHSRLAVKMAGESVKRIPVQLYESGFLLILFAVLFVLNFRNNDFKLGMPIYMISYGIWRYFAEFMRGDDRGEFFIKIFTPSQGTSILLVLGGIFLLAILLKNEKNKVQ